MSNDAPKQMLKIEWKWVVIAVVVGLIIVGASYSIVSKTFHSMEIQALIMMVGFAATGAIVAYFSPGVTINEPAVGGMIVMVLMLAFLYATGASEIKQSATTNVLLLVLGIFFSWAGGWVGEKLQGDEDSATEAVSTRFQWKWVISGVVIGFALNALFVFLLAPAFQINLNLILVAFLVSFVVTGFVVGYKSPGVTIKEPALAGVFAVVLDWVFVEFIVKLHVPASYVVSGLALGFLFSMVGAWLGEKFQESVEKKMAV
ncbi:MAG TPA: hypothetical protein VMM57_03200 [Bacteroidota bacterium]|nr:hypothetical protein [Bacteroidota bacterium]